MWDQHILNYLSYTICTILYNLKKKANYNYYVFVNVNHWAFWHLLHQVYKGASLRMFFIHFPKQNRIMVLVLQLLANRRATPPSKSQITDVQSGGGDPFLLSSDTDTF